MQEEYQKNKYNKTKTMSDITIQFCYIRHCFFVGSKDIIQIESNEERRDRYGRKAFKI